MAAVLASGEGALLSHRAAAEVYRLTAKPTAPIDITIPASRRLRREGIRAHRRDLGPYWPDLALGVETDGLRYHRTAIAQGLDRKRDEVHTAARMTVLRFTHAQVTYEPMRVRAVLREAARRASGAR